MFQLHKEFDEFWLENSKVSQIDTLMGCIWQKYLIFELKKYRGAIFMTLECDARSEEKLTCGLVGEWHEDIGKFSPEHTKFSKLGLSFDPLNKVENVWA